MGCAPAIEAEDELVEVGLEMGAAEAMVDAERPCLEVRDDAVHPRQDDVGRHGADDVGLVLEPGNAGVGAPAVGPEGGAGGDIGLDESLAQFASRRLDEPFPYLILDARYEKVREAGVIASQAVLIAIGIDWDDRRQVLGVELADREIPWSW